MVRSSGIREKVRSNALKELARERGFKRPREEVKKHHDDSEEEEDEEDALTRESRISKLKSKNSSLLSILPRPKNSLFGPTVKLEGLLKPPETIEAISAQSHDNSNTERVTEDGMIEVDVSRVVDEDIQHHLVKDLTIQKGKSSTVVVPKGKEKQKNQITYLAELSKATELERKEQAAQSRINKAAARSKYGW